MSNPKIDTRDSEPVEVAVDYIGRSDAEAGQLLGDDPVAVAAKRPPLAKRIVSGCCRAPGFFLRNWLLTFFLLISIAAFVIFGASLAEHWVVDSMRKTLMSMPSYEYKKEAGKLIEANKFDDALVVIEAGIDDSSLAENEREELRNQRDAVLAEKNSWLRYVKNIGWGALAGTADTTEGAAAALATDFFVVGDIRDLAIQGYNWASGNETDEFLMIVSAVGLATTAAPYADWAPSVIKLARKAGSLTSRFISTFGKLCSQALKSKNFGPISDFATSLWTLARKSSTLQAVHMLRYVDDPADIKRLVGFIERNPKRGAFALQVLEPDVVRDIARGGDKIKGVLGSVDDGLILAAAQKGTEGRAYLRANARWFSPSPITGVVKGVYKGNIQTFIDGIDNYVTMAITFFSGLLTYLSSFWLRRRWVAGTPSFAPAV